MKLKNNKHGFAMIEMLAVTIVVLVIFVLLYSNYIPSLANYEQRIKYNDITSKYSLFMLKKLYLRNGFDSDIENYLNDNNNVDLLSTSNGNIGCKSDYINTDDKTYCDYLVNKLGITKLIVTKDSEATKNQTFENSKLFMNYIKYLNKPVYNGSYRLIAETSTGYATTLLYTKSRYLNNSEYTITGDTTKLLAPNETANITLTILPSNNYGTSFYYRVFYPNGSDYTIVINNPKNLTAGKVSYPSNASIEMTITFTTAVSSGINVSSILDDITIEAADNKNGFPPKDTSSHTYVNSLQE